MLPIIPQDPTTVTLLDPGVPVTVATGLTENQQTTSQTYMFGFQASQTHVPLSVDYSVKGTDLTVLTAYLQQSFDGGATFQDIGVVVDLFANPQGNLLSMFAVASLVSGPIYQFRIVTLTCTTMKIDLAVS
jgi:hypothetical protein